MKQSIIVFSQTHATIIMPYKAFYMDGFEDGIGYLPDYWMDDENMIETFKEWLTKMSKRGCKKITDIS